MSSLIRTRSNILIPTTEFIGQIKDYAVLSSTADISVTATASASAQTIITGATLNYNGIGVYQLEFHCSATLQTSSGAGVIEFWMDSSSLNRTAQQTTTTQAVARTSQIYTPSAGSHTFSVRAWKSAGTFTLSQSSTYVPMHMVITRIA